jgi:hypothetical protein
MEDFIMTGFVLKRSKTDYVVDCDSQGNGGYNVVPKDIDPYNKYTIAQVEAYLAEHPEDLLDLTSINLEKLKDEARSRRDALITEVQWRKDRHYDEVALGLEPTESIQPILEYIQALRDVPQQEGFPEDIEWPTL